MSNDNYWSDDDDNKSDISDELHQDCRDLPPIESNSEDEEEYYETLKLVNSKQSNMNFEKVLDIKNNIVNNNLNNTINNPKKENKKYIYFDFKNDEKPKKWISKRMMDKKGNYEKRKFNPRLPPPNKNNFNKNNFNKNNFNKNNFNKNYLKKNNLKKSSPNILNNNDFPTL
jgi:hypothetical protein